MELLFVVSGSNNSSLQSIHVSSCSEFLKIYLALSFGLTNSVLEICFVEYITSILRFLETFSNPNFFLKILSTKFLGYLILPAISFLHFSSSSLFNSVNYGKHLGKAEEQLENVTVNIWPV